VILQRHLSSLALTAFTSATPPILAGASDLFFSHKLVQSSSSTPKSPLDQVLQDQSTRILIDLFIQQSDGGKHRSNVKVIDKSNEHHEVTILSQDKSLRLRFPLPELKDRWLQAFRYCLVRLNKHLLDSSAKTGSSEVVRVTPKTVDLALFLFFRLVIAMVFLRFAMQTWLSAA
jgi:hypothetical protein